MPRISRDEYFMIIANAVALRSTCLRRSVGCVLVNVRGHIIATGYNGVAAGMPHCNESRVDMFVHKPSDDMNVKNVRKVEDVYSGVVYPHACPGSDAESGTELHKCEAIHAEQNALLQCRDVHEIYTCYATTFPCIHCTKLLLSTSCQWIVYGVPYKDSGYELWTRAGRKAEKLSKLIESPGLVQGP